MFTGIPLAFALHLDAGAVHQQVQRTLGATVGRFTASVFWRRDSVLKSGTVQFRPTSRSRLSTKPVVWRNAMPKSTFIVRHVWTAASLQVCWRPRRPVGAASQFISGSNQIVSEPRRLSASL
jgi:hypothetical protein